MDEEQKQLRHEVTKCLRQRSVWENRYFLAKSKYEELYGKPEKTIKKKEPKKTKPKTEKKAKPVPKKAKKKAPAKKKD